jgi:4-amino-4-deoxy-L-arabinose transferase-like glycosyltransferase
MFIKGLAEIRKGQHIFVTMTDSEIFEETKQQGSLGKSGGRAQSGVLEARPILAWLFFGTAMMFIAGALWYEYRHQAVPLLCIFVVTGALFALLRTSSPVDLRVEGRERVSRGAIAALIGSGLGVCISLLFFAREGLNNVIAWRIFLLSILPIAWVALCTRRVSDRPKPTFPELTILVAVIAVGAFFRFYLLREYPYGVWFDEAQNILVAQEILRDPAYRPVFVSDFSQLPALLFYYYAGFVWVFGPEVFAVRLAVTLPAIAAIAAVWWLARDIFGARVALWAAAFMAVSRWHVTFSRFAVANIFVTLLMPLVIGYFIRGQRRRSFADSLLAGVLLGVGMQTYYAFVALPALLFIVFLYRLLTGTQSYVKGGVVMLVAAACVYAPVALFASMHWDTFSERMKIVASTSPSALVKAVIAEPSRANEILEPLLKCVRQHFEMFHLRGDRNGRHNLPGTPMLDYATGAFFGVGFFMMIFSSFRWSFLLFSGWFAMTISAGIFSLFFEAPQGARTLGLTPIISVLAALPIASLSDPLRLKGIRGTTLLIGFCAAIFAAVQTYTVFFFEHRLDPAAWAAFSTAETRIGEIAVAAGEGTDMYVPEVWMNAPAIQVITKGRGEDMHPFTSARDLPLPDYGRDAIVVVEDSDTQGKKRLSELYPEARVEPFSSPKRSQGREVTLFSSVHIPKASIRDLQRPVRSEFVGDQKVWSGFVRSLVDIPTVPGRGSSYKVVLEAALQVPTSGRYQLKGAVSDSVQIAVDRDVVVGLGEARVDLSLAQGMHHLVIERCITGEETPLALKWRKLGEGSDTTTSPISVFSPVAAPGGLTGEYRRGLARSAPIEFSRIDQSVAFYFHIIPLPRPFAIDWSGSLSVPVTGLYSIGTSSIDESTVTIDGKEYPTTPAGDNFHFHTVQLNAGLHSIKVAYDSVNGYGQAYLRWIRPDGVAEEIPADSLMPLPPSGSAVLKLPKELECR